MLRLLSLLPLVWSVATVAQTGPAGIRSSADNVLWLKADAGTSSTTNNAAINAWSDQSGNGIDVTQTVSAQQPSFVTNVINGLPAVRFDNVSNTNDKLIGPDSPLLDNTQGYSFFMVSRPEFLGDARVIISKRTGVAINQSFMHFYYTSNRFHTDIQTNNNRYQTNFTFSVNNNFAICQQFDGTLASASRCRTYVNGNLDITASETNTMIPDNASPLVIGSTDATDGRPFGGYMAEIIMYRVALPTAERIIVDNYLSAKYSIAMAANDKYAGDDAANGHFDFEVAGIGQESDGSTTTFSSSASGGMGITVTGGLGNGDYLLAGHQIGGNADNTTDVGGMSGTFNARWERVWYLDVTNASTALSGDVVFDLSDGGMGSASPAFPANYVLLYRAGQSGNWSELTTASSLNGDQIIFTGVTFNSDGYYTIGTRNFNVSTLPVIVAGFEVTDNDNKVSISWTSDLETDLLGYTVERSADGVHYDPLAAAEPHRNREYRVKDLHPLPGLNYYRLRVRETDTTWFVGPRWIDCSGSRIRVSPNPCQNSLVFFLPPGINVSEIVILAYDGTIAAEYRGEWQNHGEINIQPLREGLYTLLLRHGSQTHTSRVIVSR